MIIQAILLGACIPFERGNSQKARVVLQALRVSSGPAYVISHPQSWSPLVVSAETVESYTSGRGFRTLKASARGRVWGNASPDKHWVVDAVAVSSRTGKQGAWPDLDVPARIDEFLIFRNGVASLKLESILSVGGDILGAASGRVSREAVLAVVVSQDGVLKVGLITYSQGQSMSARFLTLGAPSGHTSVEGVASLRSGVLVDVRSETGLRRLLHCDYAGRVSLLREAPSKDGGYLNEESGAWFGGSIRSSMGSFENGTSFLWQEGQILYRGRVVVGKSDSRDDAVALNGATTTIVWDGTDYLGDVT